MTTFRLSLPESVDEVRKANWHQVLAYLTSTGTSEFLASSVRAAVQQAATAAGRYALPWTLEQRSGDNWRILVESNEVDRWQTHVGVVRKKVQDSSARADAFIPIVPADQRDDVQGRQRALRLAANILDTAENPRFIPRFLGDESSRLNSNFRSFLELSDWNVDELEFRSNFAEVSDRILLTVADTARILRDLDAGDVDFESIAFDSDETREHAERQAEAIRYVDRMRRQSETVDELTARAEEARDDLQTAANATGANELSEHFDLLSARELRSANFFRSLTIFFLILSVMYTGSVLVIAHFESTVRPTETLLRFGLTLALLALAGYTGKEAADHRREGRWSGLLAVQVRTFRAFTSPLPDDKRQLLLLALGRRLLTSSPNEAAPTLIDEAQPGASSTNPGG